MLALRRSWSCFAALALCALCACDKTSTSQGSGGHAADGGGGSHANDAATGGSLDGAGSPAKGDAGSGGMRSQAPGRGSQGGESATGGTGGPQGGDGTDPDQGGNGAATGGNGSHAAGGAGGDGGSGGSASPAGQGGSGGQAANGGSGSTPPVCEPDAQCVGPSVDSSACGLSPQATDAPVTSMTCPGMRTCTGAAAPRYRLVDFQRLSCGTQATYGLEAFAGRPTLVAIFGSWCPYCQAQTEKLDQLWLELQVAHKDIYIVVVNQAGYETSQEELRSRSSVPMLQDTAAVNAWGIHGVEKDDLLIYRSDGTLEAWLPPGNMAAPIDITTDMGYAYIKMRLMNTP